MKSFATELSVEFSRETNPFGMEAVGSSTQARLRKFLDRILVLILHYQDLCILRYLRL
jgi:hypothetical protein